MNIKKYLWFKLMRYTRMKKSVVVDVPLFAGEMRVPVRSWLGKHVWRSGMFESDNTNFLLDTLKLSAGDVAIDAGANVGWYSLLLDKIAGGGGARVFAFEPNPQNFNWLAENLKRNNANSVCAVQKGLGDECGGYEMYVSAGNAGEHSLLPIPNSRGKVAVETVTLNAYLKNQNIDAARIRFVKMDIEGFELMALRGATDILATCPLMMLEFSPGLMAHGGMRAGELVDFMESHHYRPYFLINGELRGASRDALVKGGQVDLFWGK